MTIQELETKIKELNLELKKLEEEEKRLRPWRANFGGDVYYINQFGKVIETIECDDNFSSRRHDFGDYYRTKELAEQDVKEQRLRNRVRQLRDTLCEGYKFAQGTYNYCIYYSKNQKRFAFCEPCSFYIGEIYFDTAKHAKQACDILNSEFNEEYMEEIF